MVRKNRMILSIFLLFSLLLAVYLIPISQTRQISLNEVKSHEYSGGIVTRGESWENSSNPYILAVNTLYTVPNNDLSFTAFWALAGGVYYIYLDYAGYMWNAELYNDSAHTELLGTFYQLPFELGMGYYMMFSPGHTGWYYLLLYCGIINGKVAIFNATSYTINTTRLLVTSPETCPALTLYSDLVQGNYCTAQDRLYVRVERGWDYVFLSEMYGEVGPNLIYLENGTYVFIFQESCNFRLTGYHFFPKNETVPGDPNEGNKTDDGQPGSIWDGITPMFGIGVLVGLCTLYKFKKK
jgi:hypothetical protein